ncbi:MAG TPA: aspartate aminotransferase family protein [Gaiellales bacterium]|nr:aspartate aminotransferase family protein [Gaiellales bacterium]
MKPADTISTSRSQELFELAAAHLAGGVGSGTRSPRSGWLPAPVFVDHGEGATLVDVDGNSYVDYVMGQGPLILGHRPAAVTEAVVDVLRTRGSLFSLAHDLEARAARAVCERMPSVDLVRFGNSGTECAAYAVRFARSYTGRTLVVRFEGHYHGWSDALHWSAHPAPDQWGPRDRPHVVPGSTGMPPEVGTTLIVLPWNDPDALRGAFKRHGERIAAVITEPILGNGGGIMPATGYLEHLRELTHDAGALLIFDEVLTGFRAGPGGAQQRFSVMPDLTVMAKALGAGYPVAALGGRRDVMEQAADGRTMHGGTYNSNPLVCAAVIAACAETGRPGFYERLEERGARLADGIVALAREAGLAACYSGVGGMFQVWFCEDPPADHRAAQAEVARSPFAALYAGLRARGVLIQPPQEGLWLISGAHGDEHVKRTLEAVAEVMPSVAEAADRGVVGPKGGVR